MCVCVRARVCVCVCVTENKWGGLINEMVNRVLLTKHRYAPRAANPSYGVVRMAGDDARILSADVVQYENWFSCGGSGVDLETSGSREVLDVPVNGWQRVAASGSADCANDGIGEGARYIRLYLNFRHFWLNFDKRIVLTDILRTITLNSCMGIIYCQNWTHAWLAEISNRRRKKINRNVDLKDRVRLIVS